jgi:hypothetical protein
MYDLDIFKKVSEKSLLLANIPFCGRVGNRVARWFVFKPKILIWVKF